MVKDKTAAAFQAATSILSRIEALPLVRRRGQSERHREPIYQGQTENGWFKAGRFDEGGGLLQLAARASLTVTRWQLRAAYYLAQMGHDELWATHIHDFDKTFPDKQSFQLIEVLEAVVHEKMDLPILPIYPYRLLLPKWEEVLFGEPALVVEAKDRYAYIRIEVRDYESRRSIDFSVHDYGQRKLLSVHIGILGLGTNWSCGSSTSGSPYERWHIEWLQKIMEYLGQEEVIPVGFADRKLNELLRYAKPNTPYPEQ